MTISNVQTDFNRRFFEVTWEAPTDLGYVQSVRGYRVVRVADWRPQQTLVLRRRC